MEELLKIENLKTYFYSDEGVGKAVDGVDITINKGEVMGIVGESGSGKTVTAMSVLKLIQEPGKIAGGKIIFEGENLLEKSEKDMRKIRGNKIAMIFQEPMTSLNPVFTIGDQIGEAILLHQNVNKEEAREKTIEMLKLVGIPTPEKRIDDYPHQFSGGMRQRAMIAMALSCNPSLLIADEPTTALDVTIQAQILDLMIEAKNLVGTASIMLITHDLGVVAETCDKVTVMYCGKVMEQAAVRDIFRDSMHPYTIGLMNSVPRVDKKGKKLYTIPGIVPNINDLPAGCKFCTRCEKADDKCRQVEPELVEKKPGHFVRCHYA
ncbi:MAG: ABC transporter ATP-binding protein [Candidatus Muiribacteriota bacterium]